MSTDENKATTRRRVISQHHLDLKPGVTPAQFEEFLASEFRHQQTPPGWKTSIFKCDRGANVGSYVVMLEIEDVQTRDRYFPAPGEPSEEFLQWNEQRSAPLVDFDTKFEMLAGGVGVRYSDYILIAEEAGD